MWGGGQSGWGGGWWGWGGGGRPASAIATQHRTHSMMMQYRIMRRRKRTRIPTTMLPAMSDIFSSSGDYCPLYTTIAYTPLVLHYTTAIAEPV